MAGEQIDQQSLPVAEVRFFQKRKRCLKMDQPVFVGDRKQAQRASDNKAQRTRCGDASSIVHQEKVGVQLHREGDRIALARSAGTSMAGAERTSNQAVCCVTHARTLAGVSGRSSSVRTVAGTTTRVNNCGRMPMAPISTR